VTFEGNVEVVGDGIEKPYELERDILNDYDKLLANGLV